MKFSQLSLTASALSIAHFVGCSSSATHGKVSTPAPKVESQLMVEVPSLPWEQIDRRKPAESETLLEKLSTQTATPAMRLLTRYVEADIWSSHDAAKSCALWTDLFTHVKVEKTFPLMPVAKLRAEAACAEAQATTVSKPLAFDEAAASSNPGPRTDGTPPQKGEAKLEVKAEDAVGAASSDLPWLHELRARVSLKVALRSGDLNREMRASSEIASFEHLQKERVRLLQRAIELATKLKEESLQVEYQAQLEKIAPRFITHPLPEQQMMVAGDFKQARQFDLARKAYEAIFAAPGVSDLEKSRALDGIRMSYKLQKNTAHFLRATKAYADFAREAFFATVDSTAGIKSPKKRARPKGTKAQRKKLTPSAPRGNLRTLGRFLDAQITYARAVWTEHDPKLAEEILSKAEADIAGRWPTAESAWIRARIAEESGDLARALEIFSQINPDKVENLELRSKIIWNNAWDLRKFGRKEEAATKLQVLMSDRSIPNSTRAQFWLARTYHDLGRDKDATIQYEQLINNDPTGIYGLLAYRELKRPIPPAIAAHAEAASPSISGEARTRLQWLTAAGENELAQTFLDITTYSQRANFTEAQSLDLLQLYAQAGSFQTLFSRLNDLTPSVRSSILQNHPELLFPQPWRSIASESAAQADIPIELIYSIMRQESSFNPNARSPADAFGLMQLIPEMADQAGKTIGIKIASHEELFDPQLNIPLGAAFLHQLLIHWHGQFVLAVASYNANESAIAGWVRTRYKADPLEFIEDVPYEETRSYIKLVLRNFIFYQRLNSGGRSLPFPEHCLENIQATKP